MGAVTYHPSSNNAAGSPPAKAAESSLAFGHSSQDGLADAFTAFDKSRTFRIDLKACPKCIWTNAIPGVDVPRALPFRWAIALVPDPENSNIKLDFDRQIEMILLAAQKAGYKFERYWLPWRAGGESDGLTRRSSVALEKEGPTRSRFLSVLGFGKTWP